MRRAVLGLAVGLVALAAPAAADTLKISNCSGEAPSIRVFNAIDISCAVPGLQTTLLRCVTQTIDCLGPCKVELTAGTACTALPIFSGEKTYTNRKELRETSVLKQVDDQEWSLNCGCLRSSMEW